MIDSNYYATEADRYWLRNELRLIAKILNTATGKEIVGEEVFEGMKGISATSKDEEIDLRFRKNAA